MEIFNNENEPTARGNAHRIETFYPKHLFQGIMTNTSTEEFNMVLNSTNALGLDDSLGYMAIAFYSAHKSKGNRRWDESETKDLCAASIFVATKTEFESKRAYGMPVNEDLLRTLREITRLLKADSANAKSMVGRVAQSAGIGMIQIENIYYTRRNIDLLIEKVKPGVAKNGVVIDGLKQKAIAVIEEAISKGFEIEGSNQEMAARALYVALMRLGENAEAERVAARIKMKRDGFINGLKLWADTYGIRF